MKNIEEIKAAAFYLKPTQCQALNLLAMQLKTIAEDKKINEGLLHSLININLEVSALKESIMWQLLHFAKQNHMID